MACFFAKFCNISKSSENTRKHDISRLSVGNYRGKESLMYVVSIPDSRFVQNTDNVYIMADL